MKFVLACYGVRGDVEPSVVVGRELLRRGHDVRIAVPPNLVGFAESAGLAAVAYGLDSRALVEVQREYWTCFFRIPWKLKELDRLGREISEFVTQCWKDVSTLTPLADGADLLIAGSGFEQFAANVAEYYDLPLATLHFFPMRANGQLLPFLPPPLGLQRRPSFRARQGGGCGELRGDLSGLPRGCAPRWRGNLGRGPAGRGSPVDPLDDVRSAVLCGSAQTTESGLRAALFDHYREFAGRGPTPDPRPTIPRPGPGGRHTDDQTRRKCCGRC